MLRLIWNWIEHLIQVLNRVLNQVLCQLWSYSLLFVEAPDIVVFVLLPLLSFFFSSSSSRKRFCSKNDMSLGITPAGTFSDNS